MTASSPLSFPATAAGRARDFHGPRGGRALGRILTALLATLAVAGCGSLDPVASHEVINDPARLFTSLTLDRQAIVLSTVAPYDTVRLTATPRNALGEPLEGLPAPTFRLNLSSDSTMVTVTPDGLVTARAANGNFGTTIIAELKGPDNVVQRANAVVIVNVTTDPPPQLASIAVDPVPPDSAKAGMSPDFNAFDLYLFSFFGSFYRLARPGIAKPRALDALGNEIPGVVFTLTSLDPTILPNRQNPFVYPATFFTPNFEVAFARPGQAHLVARTTVYGVTMENTLLVTGTTAVLQSVQAVALDGVARFQPSEIRLPPSGIVFFQNTLGDSVDVTFDDSTHVMPVPTEICDNMSFDPDTYGPGPYCEAGNAVMPGSDPTAFNPPYKTERLRQFPVLGVYRYHSTRTGASGQIIVE